MQLRMRSKLHRVCIWGRKGYWRNGLSSFLSVKQAEEMGIHILARSTRAYVPLNYSFSR